MRASDGIHSAAVGLSRWTNCTSAGNRRQRGASPHASCTLGVREVCRSRAAEVHPAIAPERAPGRPPERDRQPDALVEWSSRVKCQGRRRGKGAEADGTPVSLLVFPSICFPLWVAPLSATGRRPAFGCFLGFPPGLL